MFFSYSIELNYFSSTKINWKNLFPEASEVICLNVRLGSGQTSITKLFNAITAKKSLA